MKFSTTWKPLGFGLGVGLGLTLALAACDGAGGGAPAPVPCTAGATQACTCTDGAQGSQTCAAAGTWEGCVCQDPHCTPACDGKECGDDGCGGTCGPGCPAGQTCGTSGAAAGHCAAPCTPDCQGKVCGTDGCGGTCAPGCQAGEVCNADQTTCEGAAACRIMSAEGPLDAASQGAYTTPGVSPSLGGQAPDVLRLEFFTDDVGTFDLAAQGNDNYATCDQCVRVFEDTDASGNPGRIYFQTGGAVTVSSATPPVSGDKLDVTMTDVSLVEVTISDDGTFTSNEVPGGGCLVFPGTVTLTTPACVPACAGGKECGPDGCGGSCGQCGDTQTCDASGHCVGQCTPSCGGAECGSDGCSGSCGTCGSGEMCSGGQCVCEPQCADAGVPRFCGDDACGGSCGTCGAGYVCSNPSDTTQASSCTCEEDPVTVAYDASGLAWGQGSPTLYLVRGTITHTIGAGVVLATEQFEVKAGDADKAGEWVRARASGSDCANDKFEIRLTHYVYDDGQTIQCDGPGTTVTTSTSFVIPAPPVGCQTGCACPVE